MDEYADIYYVDENRNATRVDHRGPFGSMIPRPAAAQPVRTVYLPSRPVPSFAAAPQPTAATLLGKLTTGQVVEMVAQIFAALQSLPAAPVATKDPSTDVANLILFQNALAQHAKRDEQVRTLGSLVAKLVG
jgi:hypothetical protein